MSRDAWLEALQWVMTRPQLITGLPGGPEPLMRPDDPRLSALLAHSRAAWSALSATLPEHKLGRAFEALITWGMAHGMGWHILGQDVQVFEERRTLGALDLLVREPSGEVTHWELAYKLYLQCDGSTDWHSWLGPAGRDRLSIKLEHMLNRQLPLSSTPQAIEALNALDVDQIHHHRVMLQGTLFSHWLQEPATPTDGLMAAEGRWLRDSERARLVSEHPESLWVERHRPLWFGPKPSDGDVLSADALLALPTLRRARLFSRIDGELEALYFIVPEPWGTG